MPAYLRFELIRLYRSPSLLMFTVIMPVVSYVVFSAISTGTDNGLGVTTIMMVGLAGYGALIGVLSLGAAVSNERTQGWLRQLRITPLRPAHVVVVKTIASTTVAIPSILCVGLAGYLEHGITLSPGRWVAIVALMWIGTIPFALLGLAMGYALPPNIASSASFLTFFALSVLGGLLIPIEAFPAGMQHFAHVLPSNRYAELGWRAATGHAPTGTGIFVLAAWTTVFLALAVTAYRRSAATR
jgi:ABC-2 type transport system permease protein